MNGDLCKWSIAWRGRCNAQAVDQDLCVKHHGKTCHSCGAEATHECEETGQFVCGAPLCNECEHAIFTDGTNGGIGFNAQGGMKAHCKKTEQVHKPWYAREPWMAKG